MFALIKNYFRERPFMIFGLLVGISIAVLVLLQTKHTSDRVTVIENSTCNDTASRDECAALLRRLLDSAGTIEVSRLRELVTILENNAKKNPEVSVDKKTTNDTKTTSNTKKTPRTKNVVEKEKSPRVRKPSPRSPKPSPAPRTPSKSPTAAPQPTAPTPSTTTAPTTTSPSLLPVPTPQLPPILIPEVPLPTVEVCCLEVKTPSVVYNGEIQ